MPDSFDYVELCSKLAEVGLVAYLCDSQNKVKVFKQSPVSENSSQTTIGGDGKVYLNTQYPTGVINSNGTGYNLDISEIMLGGPEQVYLRETYVTLSEVVESTIQFYSKHKPSI